MALVFHILLHGIFVEFGGGDIIAPVPQTSFGNLFGFFLDPNAGFSFYYGYSISDGIFGRDCEIQMDMVISNMPGLYLEVFPFGDGLEYSFQLLFNIVVSQYFFSVSWSKDQIVLVGICAMT